MQTPCCFVPAATLPPRHAPCSVHVHRRRASPRASGAHTHNPVPPPTAPAARAEQSARRALSSDAEPFLRDTPALLKGHAAVLGIVLAAGALLLDVVRAMAASAAAAAAANASARAPAAEAEFLGTGADASRSTTSSNSLGAAARLAEAEAALAQANRRAARAKDALELRLENGGPVHGDSAAADKENDDLALAIERRMREMDEARRAAEAKAVNAEAAIDEMHQALATELACRASIKVSQTETAQEAARVDERLEVAGSVIHNLQHRLAEVEAAKQRELDNIVGDMQDLQASIDAVTGELAEARAEAARLYDERETVYARARQLERDAQLREEELQRVRDQLSVRQAEQRDVIELQQHPSHELENQLVAARSELAALRAQVQARDQDACSVADSLRSTLSARDVELAQLSAQLHSAMRISSLPSTTSNASTPEDGEGLPPSKVDDGLSGLDPMVVDDGHQGEEMQVPSRAQTNIERVEPKSAVTQGVVDVLAEDSSNAGDAKDAAQSHTRVSSSGPRKRAGSKPGPKGTKPRGAAGVKLELAVAKQTAAKVKPEQRETPPAPKPRRGRPSKSRKEHETGPSASLSSPVPSGPGEVPAKRGRGRPRKHPLPPNDDGSKLGMSKNRPHEPHV